mmetsp:Transcript_127859/g.368215  ORF Transcript_127859/g.368215 Transcript_127859/m.368215 type:complete len:501 (-) Transcript_127859:118-1620(-)
MQGVAGVCAAVVVVRMPEPQVVQHDVVAVDLHHHVGADDGATPVLEGPNAGEDVRRHASNVLAGPRGQSARGRGVVRGRDVVAVIGGVRSARGIRRGRRIRGLRWRRRARDPAPAQQRRGRLVGLWRPRLQDQAGDADVPRAGGHLQRGLTMRRDERCEADAENNEAVLVDGDRPVQLIHAGRQQQPLLPPNARVDGLGVIAWPRHEHVAIDVQLPTHVRGVVEHGTGSAVSVEARNVDLPLVGAFLDEVGLLGDAGRRPDDGDLAGDVTLAIDIGLIGHVCDAAEDVVPAGWAVDPARHVHVAEEPLLLQRRQDGAVHRDICDEAAAGVALVVGEVQVAVDDAPPDGGALRNSPHDLPRAQRDALEGPPEVVGRVAVGAVDGSNRHQADIMRADADAQHTCVVGHRDDKVLWVRARRQQDRIALPVEVPLPTLLPPPDLVHDALQIIVPRAQHLHAAQAVVPLALGFRNGGRMLDLLALFPCLGRTPLTQLVRRRINWR